MFVILSLSTGLVYKLAVMQIEQSRHYAMLADNNRLRFVAIPPQRGVLYDRNGYPVAVNRTSYRLEITPSLAGDLDETLERVQSLITLDGEDLRRLKSKLAKRPPFSKSVLKADLSESELARFAVDRHRFPGVELAGELGRHYPYGGFFLHSAGYIGALSKGDLRSTDRRDYRGIRYAGKAGVEKEYDALLRGSPGVRVIEVDAQGRFVRGVSKRNPRSGQDILLTLDRDLQMVADEALGDYEGAVVAIDPRNGDVLTLVSKPTLDPHGFLHGFDSESYQKLRDSPRRPFFNRAISGQYSPGSTIKPVVALAGLNHGLTSPEYYIHAGPYFSVPGNTRRFHDWKAAGHGWINLRQSIAQSCDVYFYELAHRIGIDRLYDAFVTFGFGTPNGIDLIGEATGLVPSREWKKRQIQMPWFEEETVIVGIGQGYFLATPLQLAVATAMIANRGVMMQPRLVKAVRERGAKNWNERQPVVMSTAEFSPEEWQLVIDGMIDAVHRPNGTAYNIGADAGYIMAGKTGTVQTHSISEEQRANKVEITDKKLKDHAMFIAFAPVDRPVIAVAVIVEHVGSGSRYAAPIARQLLDAYFLRFDAASLPRGDSPRRG